MADKRKPSRLAVGLGIAFTALLLTFCGFVEVLNLKTVSAVKAVLWFPIPVLVKWAFGDELPMLIAAALQFPVAGLLVARLTPRRGLLLSVLIVGAGYLTLVTAELLVIAYSSEMETE